jgi:D-alanine-D-alanine ligase
LNEVQVRQAQELAIRAFQALECSGLARVDLFLEKPTGKFFVNEINTLPDLRRSKHVSEAVEASTEVLCGSRSIA